MFSPPKISYTVWGIKYICLQWYTVSYLIQPSSKHIVCFDFGKQNSVLPIVFYVLWPTYYARLLGRYSCANKYKTKCGYKKLQTKLSYEKATSKILVELTLGLFLPRSIVKEGVHEYLIQLFSISNTARPLFYLQTFLYWLYSQT